MLNNSATDISQRNCTTAEDKMSIQGTELLFLTLTLLCHMTREETFLLSFNFFVCKNGDGYSYLTFDMVWNINEKIQFF